MEPRLVQSQSQSQQLILSPQLRQYLKLLQLPLLDLQQSIEEELAQNPVLEEALSSPNTDGKESEDNPAELPVPSREKELQFDETMNQINNLDDDMRETLYHYSDFSTESPDDLSICSKGAPVSLAMSSTEETK